MDNCNLPSVKQDKVAPKITPVDHIILPGYRLRVPDRRRERLNLFKRRQAWGQVHTLNQIEKRERSIQNDAVTPTNIDEQVDSEDEMVNISLPPIDLHDPNIGPVYVSSGIPLTNFGQTSVTGNEKQKGSNVLRSDKELDEGEISLLEEETRDEFVRQIGDIVHGKSDKRQADGGSAVAIDVECNATDSMDTRVAVNNQDTVNGETRSNILGDAVNQIEIAQEIERRLQAELDKRELNTKQFYAAKRSMKDFKEFKQRNALDQLDKAGLDDVADLMKKMLESVSHKGKTSPSPKSKSPYAHLSAPLAYKERPSDIDTEPAPASSNEKPDSKTPITRSRKKEMLRILQENG